MSLVAAPVEVCAACDVDLCQLCLGGCDCRHHDQHVVMPAA